MALRRGPASSLGTCTPAAAPPKPAPQAGAGRNDLAEPRSDDVDYDVRAAHHLDEGRECRFHRS